jgi:hypothetical protein
MEKDYYKKLHDISLAPSLVFFIINSHEILNLSFIIKILNI